MPAKIGAFLIAAGFWMFCGWVILGYYFGLAVVRH